MYAVTNPEEAAPQSVLDAFAAFFESLWSPSTNPDGSTVQKAGMSYVYDEDGTLIADTLTGGAQTSWGQSARYIYLPTVSRPMPVAAIYGTKHYAIQSDHLNTPRRLIQSDGQVAWQWAYSAFGDEKPTTAKTRFANADLNQSFGTTTVPAVTFNLRYPGQYFDQESNLHYNYHRSYSATTGRYTQSDPIGLDGGWNRFGYANQNPMSYSDPLGLDTCRTVANLIFASVQLCTPTPPIPGRPGSMSPKEERYYDRHCAGTDDPCAALKVAVWKAIEQAKIKMTNMLDDKFLFRNAYRIPNPDVTGTNTTWHGHADDLEGRIASIWAMISLGRKLGCDMSTETAAALTLLTPGAPRN